MSRPKFLDCVMTAEIIRSIKARQEEYDKDPEKYERQEKEEEQRNQEELERGEG